MNKKLDAESYLKSGSNELRILEYRTCGMSFGINILKVDKIVSNLEELTKVPETHYAVKGMFRDINRLIPVVDLGAFLGLPIQNDKKPKVIVTEFFGMFTGFLVEQIDWIHHFNWENLIDAEKVFAGIDQQYVIGIVKPTEDRMVLLLDYETILLDLCPHIKENMPSEIGVIPGFKGKRILIAEDSPAVRSMLVNELTDLEAIVTAAPDGEKAWDIFQNEKFDAVICDVEMPQMDGLALTLRIRQSDQAEIPVVVYSSIGDMGMKARAKFLKADAHITKLNMDLLLNTVDQLMQGTYIPAEDMTNEITTAKVVETIELD